MNSLIKTRVTVSKIVTALVLVTAFAIAISAQRTDPQNQGKMYGDPGFKGEVMDLNVVNADVREILNYITDQYGINFVIDKSVKETPVTVKVKDVPWNIALDWCPFCLVSHHDPPLGVLSRPCWRIDSCAAISRTS